MNRCKWVNLKNPLYVQYHDSEWGKPQYNDEKLFEMLVLESFQAGLSWECVLNKRESFREAFDNFDYKKISMYTSAKIEKLMENKNIIRNRRKINATINNAKVFLKIQQEYGTFSNYIWSFTNSNIIKNLDDKLKTTSPLAKEISKDLRKKGMNFVGDTIIYSYLQSIGIVNDHELMCDFRK